MLLCHQPQMRLHIDDCKHKGNMYLGSDSVADYYLYNESGISICKRTGPEGQYETINYEYHPEYFIKTFTYIESETS
jgi:hypothetical protein